MYYFENVLIVFFYLKRRAMGQYHIPLEPGRIYHLFNRTIGKEKLFRSEENYHYFLRRLKDHILPVAQVLAYALLPNHFHLVVQVKTEEELKAYFTTSKKRTVYDNVALSDFLMERCSNWLNGYAKAYNKAFHRRGALFLDYTRRSLAETDDDITAFIYYVHKNAVHHGLTTAIGLWPFDSYAAVIGDGPTNVHRAFHLDWFGSRENFISFHSQAVNLKWSAPE